MGKYSVKDVAKAVYEDGLGYSIEKYFNDYNYFQDAELASLWKEAREVFQKIERKLEEANIPESELNLKAINECLKIYNQNNSSLVVGIDKVSEDWITYSIYSKENGSVFLIDWEEDFGSINVFFYENAFDKNYLESLKNQYECISITEYDEKLDKEDQEEPGYLFSLPSMYEIKELMLKSISEIFK